MTHPSTTQAERVILIVEDNSVNRLLMAKKFSDQGYRSLILAKNGAEALDLALKNNPDLILMDIQLPDMNGNEVIRRLRQQGFTAPIVTVSADHRQEDIDRSRASGADGYILKPIDFLAFFAKINGHLRPARKESGIPASGAEEGNKAASAPQAVRISESVSAAAKNVLIVDAKEKLPVIANALEHFDEENQRERIKAIAHEYKGIAGYYGLRELERIAQELDEGFKNDEPGELLKKLTGQLARAVAGIIDNETA